MKISIILTSYNYAEYLKETINSVLAQTYKDWELIVIDDASVDNSANIIMDFVNSDIRISFIRNYENQGLAKCIQAGVTAATGEWIAFLESDDLWDPCYLEKKIAVLNHEKLTGFIYNDVKCFGPNTAYAEKKFAGRRKRNKLYRYPKNMFYNFGYENPVLTMSSVLVKRNLFNGINFETPIDKLIDWFLYIQIARKCNFYYIPEELTLWRQHSDSYLSKKKSLKFCFPNICAYLLILKKEPWNLKLLFFVIISTFLMCLKRLKAYIS